VIVVVQGVDFSVRSLSCCPYRCRTLPALQLLQENPHRQHDLERFILTEVDLFSSAKFVRLRTLLPELVSDGHRILIFSNWTNCLDLLSCLMDNLGMNYLRMDGSTPVTERQSLIDRFNGDTSIPVFLLSTRACGLGINLTGTFAVIGCEFASNVV